MDDAPLTCTPETSVDELRRLMLLRNARYVPALASNPLMGVISLYDVAKTVVHAQDFENRLLKAYIRDWPEKDNLPRLRPELSGRRTGVEPARFKPPPALPA